MSKHTKEKWAVGFSDQGLGHGTYGVMVKDTSEVVIKDLTKDKAEEIVRRWNAFEEGGIMDELRTACLVIKGMVGNVDHTKGHGENSAKMRGDILNSIRELVEAALAKS